MPSKELARTMNSLILFVKVISKARYSWLIILVGESEIKKEKKKRFLCNFHQELPFSIFFFKPEIKLI